MDQYDLKTAKRVYRRYRKDIEAFGYEQSYRRLLKHLGLSAKSAS